MHESLPFSWKFYSLFWGYISVTLAYPISTVYLLVKHKCSFTAKQACSKVMLASAETEAADSSYLCYIQVPLPGSG